MSVFKQMARVRRAQWQAQSARTAARAPAAALLARARQYPLIVLGTAAGTGFALGTLRVRPWRVPGFNALLAGGVGEIVALATQWIADVGAMGAGVAAADAGAEAAATAHADTSP